MKTFNRIVFAYFLGFLPLGIIIGLIFPKIMFGDAVSGSAFFKWGNEVTAVLAMGWVACALYMGITLIVSRSFREQLLKKLTGIKERDEREEVIVGKAARNTFLFNLGLLIFLFMSTLIQVSVVNLPPAQIVDGHKHSLQLAIKFAPIAQEATATSEPSADKVSYAFKSDWPLAVSGTLLLLIMTQIGSFYIYARKLNRVRNLNDGNCCTDSF